MATKRKVIIDCDTGADDAQAILMALAQTDVDVIAVTCVFGNTSLENVSRNVLRVLKRCNRLDIPVYKGCSKSMLGKPSPMDGYHGMDGMGDVTIADIDPLDTMIFQDEHAVVALLRLAKENPGDVTLVCVGPLTNIALALQIDEEFGRRLKDVYTMGGTIEAKGNVTTVAEFNFHSDPEAVYYVLNNLGRQINIVSLECCSWHTLSWEWYEKYISTDTDKARFVKAIEHKMINRERQKGMKAYEQMWDQLAMAVAIDQSAIKESRDLFVTIELQGQLTRGQGVVDWQNKLQNPPNARLIMAIDVEKFKDIMYSGILS